MTQNEMVLHHLKHIGSLTRAQAYELYGITELNTRICNLRAAGHLIKSKDRCETNRFGKRVHFTEYAIVNPEDIDIEAIEEAAQS